MTYNQPGGFQPAPSLDEHPGQRGPVTRPKALDLAVKLMWLGGIIQLLGMVPAFFMGDQMRDAVREQLEASGQEVTESVIDASVTFGIVFAVIFGVLGALLWFLHAWANGKGMNWARITGTVLGVLNILFTLVGLVMPNAAQTGILPTLISLLVAALSLVIIVLMWRKENNPFYNARR
ncbi:hypothetical protein [Kytococcus sedentarius]|uniref:hypothetical protein n=1 Tax=Kytococcus sedentarius TaxID=1276 RepID=UPI0035BBB2EB